ncbi:TPA: DNA transfer protein [Kluyvera intermedia]|uniref:DNA transfer protein n=2 Tax=Enterobacteriaceae TaxID=543 RepID=A0AAC8TN68_9ENTR|nr:phage DNA ejection protein [Phytobacter ursingii]HAT2207097.1 DNA transfer protein [Kluyvera intermedia]AKL13269.1 DNA transfer protein [Phytobacter ursingii]HAT2517789.1 DNA transfer protein [Kluyvera intermedia]HAT2605924.1 DNA transfer protein [Kluyvera intermedia]HAT2682766.1 DNA transfer protein [Kluyvera intermedia]
MATWQQSVNSGGLLAGIGGNNTNAPQVSDISNGLALVRANNDMIRSGQNNAGLTALQGLGNIAQSYQQGQHAEQQRAFDQAHATAWKTGDMAPLRDFAVQNPAFVEQAQKAVAGLDSQQKNDLGNLAMGVNTALAQGPETFSSYVSKNSDALRRIGADPDWMIKTGVNNPEQLSHLASTLALGAVGPEKMFDIKDKAEGRQIQRDSLAETVRSNKAGESLTARGQDIQIRGQNISAQNAQLSANGATTDMKNFTAYSRLLKSDPEAAAIFAQVAGIKTTGADNRQVQLSDGRTVTINGKLHGAGPNAFYEATDNAGNTIRVPPAAISATASSATNAQNFAMKKDLDLISNADPKSLDFLTGITGGTGKPALGADVRSRLGSGEQRQLFNAAQRIQGKMQNQGIAAARDMGASGINTVAEAKMYFQGMPQVDFSSPEATQQSIRDIKTYTDNYNQQYNVNVGSPKQNATTNAQTNSQPAAGVHVSKSGIQFTVK